MKESPYFDPAMVSVYERIAAPYQFAAPANDLVKIAGLAEGATVLDVGTGTGVVAEAGSRAVGKNGTVIATDASCEMMRRGRKKTVHPVASEVPQLPFIDGKFDAVIAGFVVSHFESYVDGLKEMIRVCRTGGRVGMSAWGCVPNPAATLWGDVAAQFAPREQLNEAFRRHIPWDTWFSQVENIAAALRMAGLSAITTETRFYFLRIPVHDYLLSRETSVQGIVLRRAVSSAQWEKFKIAVANAFESKFENHVEYDRDAHFGVGIKR